MRTPGAEPLTTDQQALVDGCIGLMYQVARRWWKRVARAGLAVDADEFVAVCFESICRAAQTFEPAKGFRFTTHATAAMHYRCIDHADFLRGRRAGWRNLRSRRVRAGLEAGPPEGMTFGLCKLQYVRAAPDDGAAERVEARERAGMVMDRLDERTRGALLLKARGAVLTVIGDDMGVTRERARQICDTPGRSGVIRSVGGR